MENIKKFIEQMKEWWVKSPYQKPITIIGIVLILSFITYSPQSGENEDVRQLDHISYTDFLEKAKNGEVSEIKAFEDSVLRIKMNDGTELKTNYELFPEDKIIDRMLEYGVSVDSYEEEESILRHFDLAALFRTLLFTLLIFLVIKTIPKEVITNTSKDHIVRDVQERFSDIAGNEVAKDEIMETVDYLRDPELYRRNGARTPRGILMTGKPGTGKTLLAKATAGEAGVTFLQYSGSEFTGMYVALGVLKVKQMFKTARRNAPCIIFIDEFDALGGMRGANLSHNEDDRTLNHLLSELDGFKERDDIIFMVATNNPDQLDKAVTRPGRIDRKVAVTLPKQTDRKKIAELHAQRIDNIEADFDLISKLTTGFSGAEIENLTNEAVMLANKRDQNTVTTKHYEEAFDRLMIGKTHDGALISEETKITTAVHEVGHAIVAAMSSHHPDPHKVSVIARGNAGGVTMFLEENDDTLIRKKEIEDRLAVLMGGRAAEEIMFGEDLISSGASDDIKKATSLAGAYVRELGFSDLGIMSFGAKREDPVLGGLSAKTDGEIRNVIDKAYKSAMKILNENKQALESISEDLKEKLVIEGSVVSEHLFKHSQLLAISNTEHDQAHT